MRSVVVTGVSSGIGRGTAAVLLRQGWRVYGSVRRQADATVLTNEFGSLFTPLVFDVEDEAAIDKAVEKVRSELKGHALAGLVNNAGSSFEDPLLVQSVADFRTQVNINLVGMFAVTRAFAPLLGADSAMQGPKGRIVNVSSVGGKFGPPFLGAYSAAKHGVEGFSECLRRELQLIGIDVVVVGPGAVKTAIWDKAEAKTFDHLAGTIWEQPFAKFQAYMIKGGRAGLEPEEIGSVIEKALSTRNPRTRYAVVKNKFMTVTLPSLLPKRMVDRIIGRQFGLVGKTG